jgi:hypothetical protein
MLGDLMVVYVRDNVGTAEPEIFKLRCPTCRHAGAFHGYKGCNDVSWGPKVKARTAGGNYHLFSKAGTRQCPNPDCGALVFIAFDSRDETLTTYPPELIDFDATDLPANILATLEEAVACHAAGAFKACALMVRRVLEELCEDKGAKGGNLKQRIEGLKTVAVIPDELLSAADELRILGNDAAHVEAKDYDNIGKDEALIAIDLAKELLKATYQYTSLVARLKAMKRPVT